MPIIGRTRKNKAPPKKVTFKQENTIPPFTAVLNEDDEFHTGFTDDEDIKQSINIDNGTQSDNTGEEIKFGNLENVTEEEAIEVVEDVTDEAELDYINKKSDENDTIIEVQEDEVKEKEEVIEVVNEVIEVVNEVIEKEDEVINVVDEVIEEKEEVIEKEDEVNEVVEEVIEEEKEDEVIEEEDEVKEVIEEKEAEVIDEKEEVIQPEITKAGYDGDHEDNTEKFNLRKTTTIITKNSKGDYEFGLVVTNTKKLKIFDVNALSRHILEINIMTYDSLGLRLLSLDLFLKNKSEYAIYTYKNEKKKFGDSIINARSSIIHNMNNLYKNRDKVNLLNSETFVKACTLNKKEYIQYRNVDYSHLHFYKITIA